MKNVRRSLLVILVFTLGAALSFPTHALAAGRPAEPPQQGGDFRPTPCPFPLPPDAVEGRDVECGFLTVPEEHANPDGPTIELAVAIIKSLDPQPKPDPLVIAQGGPGASTIDTYLQMLLSQNNLRTDRDIVLFDQRGTLYSRPALMCGEVDELMIDLLDQDLPADESERLYRIALQQCYERLAGRGINLSAFDSLENASDIESLRLALGYEQINLYGVSYGTLLALHTMRMFPDNLRSVILDGVLPTQTDYLLTVAQTQDRAFTRLFETCRAMPDCNRSYPDLEQTFFDLVEQLNREPARVSMTDPENGKVYENVLIDGDTFLSGVFQFMYSSDLIAALPRMIYDAKNGDFDIFARILGVFVLDRTSSYGMYYSVLCAEDADISPDEQDLTGVRPQIAAIEDLGPEYFLATCNVWKVAPLDESVDAPVTSDIPTLILSGAFDPITPQEYAQAAADHLGHAYSFVFPTGGHGQMLDNDCATAIVLQFLDDPQTRPDASCIDPNATPEFYTEKTIIDLPFVVEFLNLQGASPVLLLLLVLALGVLWTAALVFPLAWLVGRFNRRPAAALAPEPGDETGSMLTDPHARVALQAHPAPEKPPFPARFAGWWPVLAAIILTVFLIFIAVAVTTLVSENDVRFFYGVPGDTRPWFILPLIFALLSLVMLVAGVQVWAKRLGSGVKRVYYTLLALDALVATVILALLGLLTAVL